MKLIENNYKMKLLIMEYNLHMKHVYILALILNTILIKIILMEYVHVLSPVTEKVMAMEMVYVKKLQ